MAKYKFEFATELEKNNIISNNQDKFLIEVMEFIDGKGYVIFSDTKLIENVVAEQGNKISILEAENEILKQELSITQDAVNELIFNSLNM